MRKRDAFFRFGEHLPAILRGEHADTQTVKRLIVLLPICCRVVGIDEAQELCSRYCSDATLDHGRACLFNACRVTCNENARLRGGARFVAYRNATTALSHIAASHVKQLRLGRKAYRQANGIDIEVLFGAFDELEVVVDFRDGNACHTVFALGLFDGVGGVERHACAGQLRRMYAIATHVRTRINQGNHFAPRLQKLVANH